MRLKYALVALLSTLALAACSRGDVETVSTATPLPRATVTGTPTVPAVPTATATAPVPTAVPPTATVAPAPTPAPTRPAGETGVIGLFNEARPVTVTATRQLGELSLTPFKLWDGVSAVIYDAQTRTETNLGPGTRGAFSPDGKRMTWVAGPSSAPNAQAWVIDLASGQKTSLGPARTADFFDNDRVIAFLPGGNNRELINASTLQREPVPSAQGPQAFARTLPDGTRLRQVPGNGTSSRYTLVDAADKVLLEFDAYRADSAGPGELVVATPPTAAGTLNIFIVSIATGRAEYISTSTYVQPNWPVGASAGYVVWTEAYCGFGPAQGKTRLYDRAARTITQLDASLWASMTPGGLIASGEFGARSLYDPKTLANVLALPQRDPAATSGGGSDVSWSPDYRYASRGEVGGHGGQCG